MNEKYSLLFPKEDAEYRTLSPTVIHDLGLDAVCRQIAPKEAEQNLLVNTLSKITADPYVIKYRCDVFEDILNNANMRKELLAILERISFLKNYGSICKNFDDKSTIWDLMHRFDEINDYIKCVDALHDCLAEQDIHSDGLTGLKKYIEKIYADNGFAQLKEDISKLELDTSNLKSITVGINLNERFEASSVGLVSINSRYFTRSNALSNFAEHISSKDRIDATTDWNEDYKYHEPNAHDLSVVGNAIFKMGGFTAARMNPLYSAAAVASVAEGDAAQNVPFYFDRVVNQMISGMVKKLKNILNKYVSISVTNMVELIPELMYYVSWAEFIEQQRAKGMIFSKPAVIEAGDGFSVKAKEIYNIKLIHGENASEIVTNDISFDEKHRMYILTGANRGGKTTVTQAVGQLFVLAQGGIYIPGEAFEFSPVDSVFTHFPADEDKTFDLGRLGEECKRFKEIFSEATAKSLVLMNETFSTTSFEEGYFIAVDSIRALLTKGIRTIYNTHMHKLALDIDVMNEGSTIAKAYSLVVCNDGANRSYKVKIAPPQGKSFASDIAKKYGVTYEMLVEGNIDNEEIK